MTPKEALVLLDNAVAHALLPRPEHVRVQDAVSTLATFIDQQASKPAAKPAKSNAA